MFLKVVYHGPKAMEELVANLRKALATFAGTGDGGRNGEGGETEPARPDAELLADLDEAIGTGASKVAVACPFCSVMINDGVTNRSQGRLDNLQAIEVTEEVGVFMRVALMSMPTLDFARSPCISATTSSAPSRCSRPTASRVARSSPTPACRSLACPRARRRRGAEARR